MRLTTSLALAALLASGTAASSADLKRAAAPTPTPTVVSPTFDAYVEFSGGYAWDKLTSGSSDVTQKGAEAHVRGTFATMLVGNYGMQFDGIVGRAWDKIESTDADVTDASVTGHLFWRDSNVGALGIVGQYGMGKTKYSAGTSSVAFDADHLFVGVEGQYFLGNATLYGQVAYHYADASFFIVPSLEANGVVATAQLRYFFTPDLMVALKGEYAHNTWSVSGSDLDVDAWKAGLRAEYRLATAPVSLFSEVSYGERTYDFSPNFKDKETKVLVGFKYSFDSMTLQQRDRAGASFDAFSTPKFALGSISRP